MPETEVLRGIHTAWSFPDTVGLTIIYNNIIIENGHFGHSLMGFHVICSARNYTFDNLNVLEMGPIIFRKSDLLKTFTRPFQQKK